VVWILKELTKIEIATFLMYLLLYLLFITIAYIYFYDKSDRHVNDFSW